MALKTNLLMIGFFGTSLAQAAMPSMLELQPSTSEVQFTAVGRPSLLRIKGEGAHATGSLTGKDGNYEGDVKVDLRDFHTGIAMRDKHMKDKYLELDKPENDVAVLHVAKLDGACVSAKSPGSCAFEGTLNLHGKTQPVAGTAKVSDDGGVKRFEAEWTIKLSDYNVTIPTFAGISVADQVEIRAEAKAIGKTL